MDLSGFRETISTRGKILPARSRMVGSVNGKSIIVPRIRVLGQGRSLAHPTIKQDQPSAADMLDGIHKPQPFFDKLLVSRETGQVPEQLSRRIPLVRVARYSGISYKKECQEKNLPSRPDAGPFSSRHSAQLFERASS